MACEGFTQNHGDAGQTAWLNIRLLHPGLKGLLPSTRRSIGSMELGGRSTMGIVATRFFNHKHMP